MPRRRFSADEIAKIGAIKYLRIRSGGSHRFIAVWVVSVDGCLYCRSWNDEPGGWYRAFLTEPVGALEIEGKEVPIRGVRVQESAVLARVTQAYGQKYTTKANQAYVEGFASPERVPNTLELAPA